MKTSIYISRSSGDLYGTWKKLNISSSVNQTIYWLNFTTVSPLLIVGYNPSHDILYPIFLAYSLIDLLKFALPVKCYNAHANAFRGYNLISKRRCGCSGVNCQTPLYSSWVLFDANLGRDKSCVSSPILCSLRRSAVKKVLYGYISSKVIRISISPHKSRPRLYDPHGIAVSTRVPANFYATFSVI